MSENQQNQTPQELEMLTSSDPESKILVLVVFKEMKYEVETLYNKQETMKSILGYLKKNQIEF